MQFLGIDTSNYTTSAALYDTSTNTLIQKKKLLPVKDGEKGLRQSDAVFHHTVQLPQVVSDLAQDFSGTVDAFGVSVFPRRAEGSYMPCFLVGQSVAQSLSSVQRRPLHTFSHQEGHIAAALYSTGKLSLLQEKFIAFHISGGTTEALLVTPNSDHILSCERIACSLDLKAGQLIDRVGVMLGMKFPCGTELEKLAEKSTGQYCLKPTMKHLDCCLSGLENQCRKLFENGECPENVAHYCMCGVLAALVGMTDGLLEKYGNLPIVFSGGVASNAMLKSELSARYGAYFAAPAFSADNAAGIAVLTALSEKGITL
ncbi:MAG: peptidase M22 [Ruminococcus sp.]|nr:peptidase M22 [Ruminococcus sp.]